MGCSCVAGRGGTACWCPKQQLRHTYLTCDTCGESVAVLLAITSLKQEVRSGCLMLSKVPRSSCVKYAECAGL
jgi:hypothetical protein